MTRKKAKNVEDTSGGRLKKEYLKTIIYTVQNNKLNIYETQKTV